LLASNQELRLHSNVLSVDLLIELLNIKDRLFLISDNIRKIKSIELIYKLMANLLDLPNLKELSLKNHRLFKMGKYLYYKMIHSLFHISRKIAENE
jgi:hypothetical protein